MATERELEMIEARTEGRPYSEVEELEKEILTLEEEQKVSELRERLQKLIDEVHPSKRHLVRKKLASVLGGLERHEAGKLSKLKEKHIGEKISKGVKEFIEYEKKRKTEKESKKPARGEMSGGLSGFGESVSRNRGY